MKFWESWEKPWTEEQCRSRYVQGDRIGQNQLAVDSGVSVKTIQEWSKRKGWVLEREQFQGELREKTKKKTIDKASDALSDLVKQHLESYQTARWAIDQTFKFHQQKLTKILEDRERPSEYREAELEKALAKFLPYNINFLTLSLERCVNGERAAAGLDYLDINHAIAYLTRLGYEITDPSIAPDSHAQDQESSPKGGATDETYFALRTGIFGIPPVGSGVAPVSDEVGSRSLKGESSREIAADRAELG